MEGACGKAGVSLGNIPPAWWGTPGSAGSVSEPKGLHGDPHESGSSRRRSKIKSRHTEGGDPEPATATQLCKEMNVTAQEGQPSENGSENRGRVGSPRHPVPCLTFAFSRKPPPGKSSGRTQSSSSQLRGRAALPGPSSPSPPAPPRPAPSGLLQNALRQPGTHRKEQPEHPGIANPAQTCTHNHFFAVVVQHPAWEASGTLWGWQCPVSAACHHWCLPSKARAAEPEQAGMGTGTGGRSGAGSTESDALGQEGPCLQGKRFPGETPDLGRAPGKNNE